MKFIVNMGVDEKACEITSESDITIWSADGNVEAELNWTAVNNQTKEDICNIYQDLLRVLSSLGIKPSTS